VTLIEVLVTLFIMAIGMLALLVLFPLGAISMGQALKDDRCASTASMAENVAIAMNVRHDPNVQPVLNASSVVYVDPYGAILSLGPVGGVIPRVSPSFVGPPQPLPSAQLADRWFSLPDDIGFSASGTPDMSNTGGVIDRGRRYSYAYLLRQLPGAVNVVNLTVVVYSSRPVGSLTPETPLAASPYAGTPNGLQLLVTGTNIKRGGWILDTGNGIFYRVTNLADNTVGTVLEVQPNLVANVTQIAIMDNVAEVFDKGTSWQP
jgi:hypothetical protein